MNRAILGRKLGCLAAVLAILFSVAVTFPSAEAAPTEKVAEALALLNRDRAEHGLKPLLYHAALADLAEGYALDMLERGFFSHNDPNGKTPFERMDEAGITYRVAGENLAYDDSVESAEAALMNSPSHRANILNPDFAEVGIGVVETFDGGVYVVQEFIGK